MSEINSTVATINLVFKLAELGAKYLENRQQRRLNVASADAIDTVEEALREFEALEIPEAYEVPDVQPRQIADDEPLLIPPKAEKETE